MRTFLVDNGSLRIDSWRNLCGVAAALSTRLGSPVEPVSVLHSSRIDPAEVPSDLPTPTTWERAMKAALATGERRFEVVPFFLGPTGAIVEYLPARAFVLKERFGPFQLTVAPFLCGAEGEDPAGVASIVAQRTREAASAAGFDRPAVLLVDHGSPRPEVTAVRDRVATALEHVLGSFASSVAAASMERREGEAYAFNEPLLEGALRDPALEARPVVVAMLFLSPGRHAGEGGDVATICEQAKADRPGLDIRRTELVGTHPAIVDLLVERVRAMRASPAH